MRLATVREACAYGRFGHTKCYEYINDGSIIAYKRGARTFIDLDSIDNLYRRFEPTKATPYNVFDATPFQPAPYVPSAKSPTASVPHNPQTP